MAHRAPTYGGENTVYSSLEHKLWQLMQPSWLTDRDTPHLAGDRVMTTPFSSRTALLLLLLCAWCSCSCLVGAWCWVLLLLGCARCFVLGVGCSSSSWGASAITERFSSRTGWSSPCLQRGVSPFCHPVPARYLISRPVIILVSHQSARRAASAAQVFASPCVLQFVFVAALRLE